MPLISIFRVAEIEAVGRHGSEHGWLRIRILRGLDGGSVLGAAARVLHVNIAWCRVLDRESRYATDDG